MAKYFGMKFETEFDLVKNSFEGLSVDTGDFLIVGGYALGSFKEAYYVHPDSLGLLEPRAGDLWAGLEDDARCCVWYIDTQETAGKLAKNEDGLRDRIRCYHRNGAPFIWPEIENE